MPSRRLRLATPAYGARTRKGLLVRSPIGSSSFQLAVEAAAESVYTMAVTRSRPVNSPNAAGCRETTNSPTVLEGSTTGGCK